MQRHLHYLLQKQMSRKEFLTTVAFGMATLVGLSTFLQLLGKQNPWHVSRGYGSNSYGGGSKLPKE